MTPVSASTPSAPMTMPAITTPCNESPGLPALRTPDTSLTFPSRRARLLATTAETLVSPSVAEIPNAAESAWAPTPFVSTSVTNITVSEPTSATRIAG